MDIRGLEDLLQSIERGERRLIAREMTEPSPLAQEILTAKPYAFLDDAPAEERRTLAVMNRRFLDAETAADLGRLDQAAIDRVREEAWPQAENADELHDALMQLGFITTEEGQRNDWQGLFDELVAERRASVLDPVARTADFEPQRTERSAQSTAEEGDLSATSAMNSASSAVKTAMWVATERLNHLRSNSPGGFLNPQIFPPANYANEEWSPADALVEVARTPRRAWAGHGSRAAESFSLPANQIEIALASWKAKARRWTFDVHAGVRACWISGQCARGRSRTGVVLLRRLLARIHRYTLNRLRKEIEPVSAGRLYALSFCLAEDCT